MFFSKVLGYLSAVSSDFSVLTKPPKRTKKAPDRLRPRASFYIATGEVAGCLQFCFCGVADQSVDS